jgi:hypothetical protein
MKISQQRQEVLSIGQEHLSLEGLRLAGGGGLHPLFLRYWFVWVLRNTSQGQGRFAFVFRLFSRFGTRTWHSLLVLPFPVRD